MKVVERVEDFFLSLVFAGQELNIVHEPNFHMPMLTSKVLDFIALKRIDELLSKLLSSHVNNGNCRIDR